MGQPTHETLCGASGYGEERTTPARRRGFRGEFEGTPRTTVWCADLNGRLAGGRPTGYGQGRASDEKPDSYGQGEGVDEDAPDRGRDDVRPKKPRPETGSGRG